MDVIVPRSRMPPAVPTSWWAALSVGAAAIHFAVIPEHLEEWWVFGVAFAALGWFQVVWPFAFLERPTRGLAWLAIALNLGTVLVWAWSRAAGLPVGPEPGMPEAIGAPDVVATAFELVLAGGLLLTGTSGRTEAGSRDEGRRRSVSVGAVGVAAWVLVAILSTLAIALAG